ncbi:hypothetical protein HYS93_01495 [Candidatus Daviesbacteria bacterium]|nr:hypothetical protein [Candidatus Daviesbacteria bacterium]
MVNPYLLILVVVFLLTPFVLLLASKQSKKVKQRIRLVWVALLFSQLLLGFLGWERLLLDGRNGFELALTYPESLLYIFFLINLFQLPPLIFNHFLNLVVLLNFINTFIIFLSMIKLSSLVGSSVVSLANIGLVFLVLIGNVLGLILINKDRKLLNKY